MKGDPAPPTPLALADIPLPEGLELPEEIGGQLVELLNTPPESKAEFASQLISLHTSLLEKVAGTYAQQWEQTQESWREQVRQLPEIGGQNLQKTLSGIARVFDRYGSQEARDALALTGAGNHPALVQMFAKIAKELNEATPVTGAAAPSSPKDRAERMFKTS